MYGLRHYVEIGSQSRNMGKTNKPKDYSPRFPTICRNWVMAGESTYVFTEVTCDECLETLLQLVLNNLVMVESGHYEAIEAGWSFVRAREARERVESGVSTKTRKKAKKKPK